MESQIGCAVVFMFAAAAFLLWGVISPRSMWMRTQAWQYKDPEANEPSDAAFAVTRVSCAIAIAVLLCTAGSIGEFDFPNDKQEYEECLAESEDDWLSDGDGTDPGTDPWDGSTDHFNDPTDPWDDYEAGGDTPSEECEYLSPSPEPLPSD